jgi:hypothetical protein
MTANRSSQSGLDALLAREESILPLVDHQAVQFANMHSHEPQLVVGNVAALARTAKIFGVPTVLTTVLEDRGGYLIKGIQDVYADRPVVRGELLLDVFRPHDRSGYARVAAGGRSESALGSTVTAFPASSQSTPAERAGLFLKGGGEPR